MPQADESRRNCGFCNRAKARRYALEYADMIGRGDVIQRVGDSFYAALDATIRRRINALVETHPSGLRTLGA